MQHGAHGTNRVFGAKYTVTSALVNTNTDGVRPQRAASKVTIKVLTKPSRIG